MSINSRSQFMNIIMVLLITLSFGKTLYFILTVNPEQIAYSPHMIIDGYSTFSSAKQMILLNQWTISIETYHSAGMQVLTSWLFRVFGTFPLVVKLFNYFCYILSVGLIFWLGIVLQMGRQASLLAATLLAFSNHAQNYSGTLQYEIFVMALLLSMTLFYFKEWYYCFGIVVGILLFFRLHLITLCSPFWVGLLIFKQDSKSKQNSRSKKFKRSLVGTCSLIIPLYLIYAWHFQDFSGFQKIPSDHSKKWLCLGAEGWNFPYFNHTVDSICRWSFTLQYPGEYIFLLIKRMSYWLGFTQDIWWMPLFLFTNHLFLNHVFLLLLIFFFILGVKKTLSNKDKGRFLCAMVPLTSFLPFLIAGASTRFLVPALPFIYLTVVQGCRPPNFLKLSLQKNWE